MASREALSGKTGADVIENAGGDLVLSAYAPVEFPGIHWAIISEKNMADALSLGRRGSETDFFKAFTDRHDHPDILLVSEDGHVPYTVGKRDDYRTNLLTGKYSQSNLGGLVRQVLDSRKGGMSDVELYAPGGQEPALFMAHPLPHDDHIDLIVAVELSLDEINKILHEREGMGSTYESYLVGFDKRMRSDAILDIEGHSLTASLGNTVEKGGVVDTEASREALQGKSGAKAITDYRGVPVLSAYAPIDIDGIRWALITEIDVSEVEAPAVSLRNWGVFIGFSVTLVMAVLVWAFSTSLSRPIVELSKNAKTLADGNLAQKPAMRRTDEIGELSRALESMIVSWRSIVQEIMDGATRLSSSSAEIAAAAEKMSLGADSQVAMVLRTSSAMEEMSRSIQEVSDNARGTLDTAIIASNHAREGAEEVRRTVDGFNQADASIRRLNHRVQKIGRVVQLIGEIAAQTGILAFNAAIEAARAGEHGRGFDVVAEEVRRLAQRTTNSTTEITAIIEEIQRETENVVQIIVTGAIEVGAARKSLEDIVHGIVSTTEMVQMISSAAAQQARTAEGIAEALQNISCVSKETAQGSNESAKTTQDLAALADQLKEIIGQFKI